MLAIIVAVAVAFASMVRVGGPLPMGRPVRGQSWVRPIPAVGPASAPAGLLAVPVPGVDRGTIRDSWGEARDGGARAHHGTDIMAPGGSPVVAAAPGTIEKLFQSAQGGVTLYERSTDRRWLYYYAHLAGYAPGVHEGQAVRPGDPLGFVGDTGDAGPGNYHLHFGLSRVAPDDHWWQGEDVDPFPLLAGRPAPR